LLGQPKRKAIQEVGKIRVPWKNDNILQTSSQGWGATRPQIHIRIHKAFEMENHFSKGNYDSFWTFETNNK
jgi:hypothetical protein